MALKPKSDDTRWVEAAKHLSKVDPVLGKVIARVGACTISPRKDYFVALCRAIFGQQVSTKVAEVLFQRFKALCPAGRVTPAAVIELLRNEANIKAAGLSRQKAVYLRDLAEHFTDNRIPIRKLAKMTDDDVIESLVAVKGVGRWTAEMFLMFVLNRPDVLPVDDLGLREGVRDVFNLPERPKPAEVTEMGERWRPYRSVATWYFWRRNTGKVPDAKSEEPISDRAAVAVKVAKKAARTATVPSARGSARRSPPAPTRSRSGHVPTKS
jgi:DNA-3-methyladenine glycosylase II